MFKIKTTFICLLLALSASPVFAINNEDNIGGTLTVDADIPLNFNFSPSVAGEYLTEGTTGNEQWYAIATYHNGGSLFYGSGSDQTSVFKRVRATSQTFADASVPTKPVLDDEGNPAPWVTEVKEGETPPVDDWYR
ncbi:MAG: hypothetical protein RBT64_09305 [Trichloromonas sp.]|jgi:hypothetical protein|nr:hypothetical protein [Trichloromonas sp.]